MEQPGDIFIFCYYFWLYNYWEDKEVPIGLFIITALLSGYAFATREETILFIVPLAISFLIVKKCNFKIYILFFSILAIGYLPQLIVKYKVLGSILDTGRDNYKDGIGYISRLTTYHSIERLSANTIDVLFNSELSKRENTGRLSILQSSPWLWLTPLGVVYFFIKKDEEPLMKVFILVSIAFLLFYLAGKNMSAHKLKYHCIRYVIPSYIAFDFAIVYLFQVIYRQCWNIVKNRLQLRWQINN